MGSSTCLLLHLAHHTLLECLAELEEAGERAVPPLGPPGAAPEQAALPLAVRHEDDNRGIEAGTEAGLAYGALPPLPLAVGLHVGRAALRAEGHAAVPLRHACGGAEQRSLIAL